jgi:hypothetical protein
VWSRNGLDCLHDENERKNKNNFFMGWEKRSFGRYTIYIPTKRDRFKALSNDDRLSFLLVKLYCVFLNR